MLRGKGLLGERSWSMTLKSLLEADSVLVFVARECLLSKNELTGIYLWRLTCTLGYSNFPPRTQIRSDIIEFTSDLKQALRRCRVPAKKPIFSSEKDLFFSHLVEEL